MDTNPDVQPTGDNFYADPDNTGVGAQNPSADPARTARTDADLTTHTGEEAGNIYSDPDETDQMRSTDQINAGIFEDGTQAADVDEHGNPVVTADVGTRAGDERVYDGPDYGTVVDDPAVTRDPDDAPLYEPSVEAAERYEVGADVQRDEYGNLVDDLDTPVDPDQDRRGL